MKKFPLFNNGHWVISAFRAANGIPCLIVESLSNGFCDYPIMYTNGDIAYDHPERLPKYVKRAVTVLLKNALAQQWRELGKTSII